MTIHRKWAAGVAALALAVGSMFFLRARPAARSGDYWMYVATYTTRGGNGIYLYKFHADSGKLEASGLAEGRLWQSNSNALAGSPGRVFSQIRAGWPDFRKILRGVQDPAFIRADGSGRYLYTANAMEAGAISAFQIDPTTGKLAILNTESSGGALPVYSSVDKTGRHLLVANYKGTVAVLPIGSTGYLGHATAVIRHAGAGAHAHSIVLSPDNRFALAADTGLDQIFVYKFDAAGGGLATGDPPFLKLPRGTAPRHLAFHPNGNLVYAIGESGSSVTAMKWDALNGVLAPIQTISTLPAGFHGENGGAELAIHPNGRFLYASNRGHDSIAVFRVDDAAGTLTLVSFEPSYGKRPSNMRIDPTGNWLMVTNVFSNNLVEFRLDPGNGGLNPVETIGVPSPMGLEFVVAR
ncbi:MAG: lactonase family protein [Terriglobia bacterium]